MKPDWVVSRSKLIIQWGLYNCCMVDECISQRTFGEIYSFVFMVKFWIRSNDSLIENVFPRQHKYLISDIRWLLNRTFQNNLKIPIRIVIFKIRFIAKSAEKNVTSTLSIFRSYTCTLQIKKAINIKLITFCLLHIEGDSGPFRNPFDIYDS